MKSFRAFSVVSDFLQVKKTMCGKRRSKQINKSTYAFNDVPTVKTYKQITIENNLIVSRS